MQSTVFTHKITASAANLAIHPLINTANNLPSQENELEPDFAEEAKSPLIRFNRLLTINLGYIIFSAFNDIKKGGLRFEESLANKFNECLNTLNHAQKKRIELEWQPVSIWLVCYKPDNDDKELSEEYEKNMPQIIKNYGNAIIQQIRNFFASDIVFINPYQKDYNGYYEKLIFFGGLNLNRNNEEDKLFFKTIIHETHIARFKRHRWVNLYLNEEISVTRSELNEFVSITQDNNTFVKLCISFTAGMSYIPLVSGINIPFLRDLTLFGFCIALNEFCTLLKQTQLKQLNSLTLNVTINILQEEDVNTIIDLLLNLLTTPDNALTTLALKRLGFYKNAETNDAKTVDFNFYQAGHLFSALCHPESMLENVTINCRSDSNSNSNSIDEFILRCSYFLSNPLGRCKNFTLELTNSSETKIDSSDFFKSLKHNSTLESFSLDIKEGEVDNITYGHLPRITYLTEQDMASLIDLLDNHQQTNKSTLTSLNLGYSCRIDKSLQNQFFSGLRRNTLLSSLRVRCGTYCNTDTQQNLLSVLEENKTLTLMNLDYDSPSDKRKVIEKINEKLEKNKCRIESNKKKWIPIVILIAAYRVHQNHFFAPSVFNLIPTITRLLELPCNIYLENAREPFCFRKK